MSEEGRDLRKRLGGAVVADTEARAIVCLHHGVLRAHRKYEYKYSADDKNGPHGRLAAKRTNDGSAELPEQRRESPPLNASRRLGRSRERGAFVDLPVIEDDLLIAGRY